MRARRDLGLFLVLLGLVLGLHDVFLRSHEHEDLLHDHEHEEQRAPEEHAYALGIVDFGSLHNGQVVERAICVPNDSGTTWTVERVWASCGCLSIEISDRVAMPGESLCFEAVLSPTTSPPGPLLQTYSVKLAGTRELLTGAVRASLTPSPSVFPSHLALEAERESGFFSGRLKLSLPQPPTLLSLDPASISAGLSIQDISTRNLSSHVEIDLDLQGSLAPGVNDLRLRVELSARAPDGFGEPGMAVDLVVTRAPAGVVHPAVLLVAREESEAGERVAVLHVRDSRGRPPATVRVLDREGQDLATSYDPGTGRTLVSLPARPVLRNHLAPPAHRLEVLRLELGGTESSVGVPLFELPPRAIAR